VSPTKHLPHSLRVYLSICSLDHIANLERWYNDFVKVLQQKMNGLIMHFCHQIFDSLSRLIDGFFLSTSILRLFGNEHIEMFAEAVNSRNIFVSNFVSNPWLTTASIKSNDMIGEIFYRMTTMIIPEVTYHIWIFIMGHWCRWMSLHQSLQEIRRRSLFLYWGLANDMTWGPLPYRLYLMLRK